MMKRLFSFFVRGRYALLVLAAFAGITALVYHLYALPLEAVLYVWVLCLALGLLVGAYRFYAYCRRRREVERLWLGRDIALDRLPEPEDDVETAYQALAQSAQSALREERTEHTIAREELLDYYTLWTHQIKTPIAAMDLLLQKSAASDRDLLGGELFKIEQYVAMALQYLRLDGIGTDLVIQSHPLDDIIRQALRKYSRLFILSEVSLEYETVNTWVVTDEKWLVFVIEQLLSNAIKYSPRGRVTITMEGKDNLIITDTGIGIDAADLPRVFDRGYTGYNGRADKKSTGLGLYLCRQITSRLGHDIRIASQVSQGTRVTLDLSRPNYLVE